MPENVRIVLKDGSELGCEIYYSGRDAKGIHMWVVTAAVPPLAEVDHIAVDVLPSKTGLLFKGAR